MPGTPPAPPGGHAVDVLVVGAGPAGTAAAITAARAGARVTLVDRARFPRDKTCGDGLTAGALRLLEELAVPLGHLGAVRAVRETVLVSPSGRRVVLPMPDDGWHAAVVPRRELDHLLVRTAVGAGVELVEGIEVTGVHAGNGSVTVVGDDGRAWRAGWVIAADGHWSPVRRLVDAGDRRPDTGGWIAFRQYVSAVADDRLWVCFPPDLLPGYAWVFPLPGGRANVGFGVPRGPSVTGAHVARQWRALWAGPLSGILGPDARPEGRARAWPIPTSFRADRLTVGRILFVGDAAGVADPMTGEGVAQALATGVAAARAVTDVAGAAPGAGPTPVAAAYRAAVERELGTDLRFARTLGAVLARRWGTRAALRAVDTCDWTRRCFARWMFEDYPRAVLLTPRRWRRRMFRPPGSYPGVAGTVGRGATG